MREIAYDKVITIVIMCLWFIFPLGLFIAIVKQGLEEKHPKASKKSDSKRTTIPHVLNNYDNSEYTDHDHFDPDDHLKHQDQYAHFNTTQKTKSDHNIQP